MSSWAVRCASDLRIAMTVDHWHSHLEWIQSLLIATELTRFFASTDARGRDYFYWSLITIREIILRCFIRLVDRKKKVFSSFLSPSLTMPPVEWHWYRKRPREQRYPMPCLSFVVLDRRFCHDRFRATKSRLAALVAETMSELSEERHHIRVQLFAYWKPIYFLISFSDIFGIFANPRAHRALIDSILNHLKKTNISIGAVVGLEARGFVFGPQVALELQVPFVPIRKKGKLPGKVAKIDYDLEYGPWRSLVSLACE